jgi:peptidoglycan/LPS O-acetylase OafA/YrhL
LAEPASPESVAATKPAKPARRHDLDALRGFAMLLGIALHVSLAFFPTFWPVQDTTASYDGLYDELLHAIHGFRMPLFFLLSGFFTAMLWRRRGLRSLLEHRVRRILIPLAIGVVTIVPLMNWVSEKASADQFDSLLVAVFFQNETAVENLLDAGADPDEPEGESGDSPLHVAALVDNAEIAVQLLEAGANPVGLDNNGDSPLGYAYYSGSEDVADLLVAYGHPDIRPAGTGWGDLEGWGFGAEENDDFALDSWVTSLHHLWFLWFLVLLVAGFAVVAVVVEWREARESRGGKWPRRAMWALIPLTLVPQLAMGDGGAYPAFGPDTSAGLVPIPHVLIYYAVFFGFGALLYDRRGRSGVLLVDTLGSPWKWLLPMMLLLLFPVALGLTFEAEGAWGLASIAQVAYTWGMIIALMGVFRAFLAKERRGVRYLSDSSYWLYLAHLPLVILAQAWIREWDLPASVKFFGLTAVVSGFLLVTYQLFVRYTPIGTMLNGRRIRPANSD